MVLPQVATMTCIKTPRCFHNSVFGSVEEGYSVAKDFFLCWEKDVITSVPRERLLVHNAKDGWEPLCIFFGLSEPSRPYPWVNDTNELRAGVDRLKTFCWMAIMAVLCLVGSILWLFVFY